MAGQWLVRVEIPKIQRYVVASERLRELVGASALVREATEEWPKRFAGVKALAAGGGRALALVNDADLESTLKTWSKRFITDAPGLPYLFAAAEVSGSDLRKALKDVEEKLRTEKLVDRLSARLAPLPITLRCESTGDAAARSGIYR